MKKPGLRTIKTALSVVIGAAFIDIINFIFGLHMEYFYICITSVFTLQKTGVETKDRACSRVFGTFIGAGVAIIIGFLRFNVVPFNIDLVFLFFGIITVISLINYFKLSTGVMIGCIMVIASFKDLESSYIIYTIFRSVETILGAYIAIFVNKYIFPYKEKDEKSSIG